MFRRQVFYLTRHWHRLNLVPNSIGQVQSRPLSVRARDPVAASECFPSQAQGPPLTNTASEPQADRNHQILTLSLAPRETTLSVSDTVQQWHGVTVTATVILADSEWEEPHLSSQRLRASVPCSSVTITGPVGLLAANRCYSIIGIQLLRLGVVSLEIESHSRQRQAVLAIQHLII